MVWRQVLLHGTLENVGLDWMDLSEFLVPRMVAALYYL
jgi:hypothetical protein